MAEIISFDPSRDLHMDALRATIEDSSSPLRDLQGAERELHQLVHSNSLPERLHDEAATLAGRCQTRIVDTRISTLAKKAHELAGKGQLSPTEDEVEQVSIEIAMLCKNYAPDHKQRLALAKAREELDRAKNPHSIPFRGLGTPLTHLDTETAAIAESSYEIAYLISQNQYNKAISLLHSLGESHAATLKNLLLKHGLDVANLHSLQGLTHLKETTFQACAAAIEFADGLTLGITSTPSKEEVYQLMNDFELLSQEQIQ